MRVSWNWLCEHVDLEGLTPAEVADRLTMSGLEVEEIHELGTEPGKLAAVMVRGERHDEVGRTAELAVDGVRDLGHGGVEIGLRRERGRARAGRCAAGGGGHAQDSFSMSPRGRQRSTRRAEKRWSRSFTATP